MATLVEFLKTGRLDGISVGISRDEVRALLGEPEDVSTNKFPQTWKYGPLQLAFYKSADGSNPLLASISMCFHEPEQRFPEAIKIDGWLPDPETTFDAFRTFLDANHVRVIGGVTSGPDKHLVLESAVRVTFDEDLIDSIGYSAKREPETKQLTVKVRREDLELIQKWAKGRGVSASDLCSEWIKDQVSNLEKAVSP
jgi:hypothetical protein